MQSDISLEKCRPPIRRGMFLAKSYTKNIWGARTNAEAASASNLVFTEMARDAYAHQGLAAFDNTRHSTALHEAGHAVVAAAHGWVVSRTLVKTKKTKDGTGWIGRTYSFCDGEPVIMGTTPETSVQQDLDCARNLMAGVSAEILFDGADFRRGSSLDEIAFVKVICANIESKTGTAATEVMMQVSVQVLDILKRHAGVVELIAAELLQRGTLYRDHLQKLLAGVQPIRPEARTGVGYDAVVRGDTVT